MQALQRKSPGAVAVNISSARWVLGCALSGVPACRWARQRSDVIELPSGRAPHLEQVETSHATNGAAPTPVRHPQTRVRALMFRLQGPRTRARSRRRGESAESRGCGSPLYPPPCDAMRCDALSPSLTPPPPLPLTFTNARHSTQTTGRGFAAARALAAEEGASDCSSFSNKFQQILCILRIYTRTKRLIPSDVLCSSSPSAKTLM